MRKKMLVLRVTCVAIVILLGCGMQLSAQTVERDTLGIKVRDSIRVSEQYTPRYIPRYDNHRYYNPAQKMLELPKLRTSNFKIPSIEWPKYDKVLRWGVPAALIGTGILCKTIPSVSKVIDRGTAFEVQEDVQQKFPIDNYTQYTPLLGVYALDFLGVPAKHSLKERLVLGATSMAIMGVTVNSLKCSIHRTRPDHSDNLSFPSGHTAMAFTGAHLLYKEYKDASIWIPVAGYSVAALTASLRVINNKHYISDTLAGAGIGILSVELAYQTLPFWRRVLKLPADKQFVMTPMVGEKNIGAYVAFTF